jgi:hypothetical protein
MNASNKGFTGVLEIMSGCEDLFLKIPDDFMQEQAWLVGDVLDFDVQKRGLIVVTNKTKLEREVAFHKGRK